MKLAVIHDLAEAVYGDIPATEQNGGSDKLELEKQAMNELLSTAPPDVKSTFFELWEEYEEMRSDEAKFLKGLDKLETILQHNQGINAPDFDYAFNLSYGRQYMDAHPLLVKMRTLLDIATQDRADGNTPFDQRNE